MDEIFWNEDLNNNTFVADWVTSKFNEDVNFIADAKSISSFTARRLGYPIMSVELHPGMIYSFMEDAANKFIAKIIEHKLENELIDVIGLTYTENLTNKFVAQKPILSIAPDYGSIVGAGGNVDWKYDFIEIKKGIQIYDMNIWAENNSDIPDGSKIEIKTVMLPNDKNQKLSDIIGFQDASIIFREHFQLLKPIYSSLLQKQNIEMTNLVFSNLNSFNLINNKLTMFPLPTEDYKLWFYYIIKDDNNIIEENKISSFADAPYQNIEYSKLNDMAKNWIRSFTLSISKETLGLIRNKFASIPGTNDDITLNGDSLVSDGKAEQDKLIEELSTFFEKIKRSVLIENKKNELENNVEILSHVPLGIYVG